MAIGGLVVGAGALWLLSQLGKKTTTNNTGGKDMLNLIASDLAFVQPKTITATVLGSTGGEILAKALSLFIGIAGVLSQVGYAAGPAAVIAGVIVVVIIAAVTLIGGAIQNDQWEHAAIAKGVDGLRSDYVTLGIKVARDLSESMINGGPPQNAAPEVVASWPSLARMWSSVYAANVMAGYNQISVGLWSPDSYWEARAMFVPPGRMGDIEGQVAAAVLLPAELSMFGGFDARARKQARDWGTQFGRVLWGYLCARQSMIEPWQFNWAWVAAKHASVGSQLPGAMNGWDPVVGANLMILGAQNYLGTATAQTMQNLDKDGKWINPSAISLGEVVSFFTAGMPVFFKTAQTVAYPYVVDWAASGPDFLSVSPAASTAKPPGFNDMRSFGGYSASRAARFKTLTRGRYGR